MDILHLKKEEIEQMSIAEKYDALCYCTTTYTVRRVDYTLAQMFSDKKTKKFGKPKRPNAKVYTFENSLVDNFVAGEIIKEFEAKKNIPKGSYFYKGGGKK